jgi:hypothetical protein
LKDRGVDGRMELHCHPVTRIEERDY